MRKHSLMLTLPLLLLAGCNYAPTSITSTSINGVKVLDSAIRESDASTAEFACNDSSSGLCYYVVFTSDCHNDTHDPSTNTCTTRRITDFAVARGESKSLSGLPPGYKHCVAQAKPTPPQCAQWPQG